MAERWNERADRSAAGRRPRGTFRRWVRRNRTRATLLATAAAGFVLLYGLEVAAERGGRSIDPTDPANYNTYALRNDSAAARYVHLCADPACVRLDPHGDWVDVRPGSATDEQVYRGPQESAVYGVATTTDGPRQCLVLDAAVKAPATVDAPLSSAGRCGG